MMAPWTASFGGCILCTFTLALMGQEITFYSLPRKLKVGEDNRDILSTTSDHNLKHLSGNQPAADYVHNDLVDIFILGKAESTKEEEPRTSERLLVNNLVKQASVPIDGSQTQPYRTNAERENNLIPPFLFGHHLSQKVKRYSFLNALAHLFSKGDKLNRFQNFLAEGDEKLKHMRLGLSPLLSVSHVRLNHIISGLIADSLGHADHTSRRNQEGAGISYKSSDDNDITDLQGDATITSETLGSENAFGDVGLLNRDVSGKKFEHRSVVSFDGSIDNKNDEENRKWNLCDKCSHVRGWVGEDKKGISQSDSIEVMSSSGGFEGNSRVKRKFDSIDRLSSFGGFGRDREEKRKFDSIERGSSFGGFGRDREGKRKFDSIERGSSFGSFGRDRQEKRKFDSIERGSSFGGFGRDPKEKRKFDSIERGSSFGGFGRNPEEKRKFDSIERGSSFGGFGRDPEEKRKFDSIERGSSFGHFSKRDDIVKIPTKPGSFLKGSITSKAIEDTNGRLSNNILGATYNDLQRRFSKRSPIVNKFLEGSHGNECVYTNEVRADPTDRHDCGSAYEIVSRIARNIDMNVKAQKDRHVKPIFNGIYRRRFDRIGNSFGKFLSFGKRTLSDAGSVSGYKRR